MAQKIFASLQQQKTLPSIAFKMFGYHEPHNMVNHSRCCQPVTRDICDACTTFSSFLLFFFLLSRFLPVLWGAGSISGCLHLRPLGVLILKRATRTCSIIIFQLTITNCKVKIITLISFGGSTNLLCLSYYYVPRHSPRGFYYYNPGNLVIHKVCLFFI